MEPQFHLLNIFFKIPIAFILMIWYSTYIGSACPIKTLVRLIVQAFLFL